MIEKLFARKEIDDAARQRFERAAGWRYGVLFGAILVLVGSGVDGWESANASLEFFWVKGLLATITFLPLGGVAGALAARTHSSARKMAIWGISGAISGWIAIHLPFEGVSAVAALIDPGLNGVAIFPFAPAAQERVAGMIAFGAAAGLIAAWLQRPATFMAWDRSSVDNRLTLSSWAALLLCAPVAIGLGAVYDGGANASLRGPSRLTHRLIQVAQAAPPDPASNRIGLHQSLDYGMTLPWRDKITASYVQRIADFDQRELEEAIVDIEFDNSFQLRCEITNDMSNVRRCFDLEKIYGDWTTQFLATSRVGCDECALRIAPTAITWQTQNGGALGNPRRIDLIHHAGGVVTVRIAYENPTVECRIVGAAPANLRECKLVK